jgi:hypothetical protein
VYLRTGAVDGRQSNAGSVSERAKTLKQQMAKRKKAKKVAKKAKKVRRRR